MFRGLALLIPLSTFADSEIWIGGGPTWQVLQPDREPTSSHYGIGGELQFAAFFRGSVGAGARLWYVPSSTSASQLGQEAQAYFGAQGSLQFFLGDRVHLGAYYGHGELRVVRSQQELAGHWRGLTPGASLAGVILRRPRDMFLSGLRIENFSAVRYDEEGESKKQDYLVFALELRWLGLTVFKANSFGHIFGI